MIIWTLTQCYFRESRIHKLKWITAIHYTFPLISCWYIWSFELWIKNLIFKIIRIENVLFSYVSVIWSHRSHILVFMLQKLIFYALKVLLNVRIIISIFGFITSFSFQSKSLLRLIFLRDYHLNILIWFII